MKFKRNYLLLIILCLFIFPKNVFAEEPIANDISCTTRNISVSICDSEECDFNDLDDAFNQLMSYRESCPIDNLTINIGEGYYYAYSFYMWDLDTFKIKGASKDNTVVRINDYFQIGNMYDIRISDLTLKSDSYDMAIDINESENVYLNNLLVDAKNAEVGIDFSHNDNVKVNNTVVRNAKQFGIYNNQCGYSRSSEPIASDRLPFKNIVSINNSDISNNECGVLDGCLPLYRPNSSEIVAQGGMLAYGYDTTIVSNSKIACARAYGKYYYNTPPSIYIESNNTWVEKPVYDENVIEEYDGRVIVDLEEDKTVSLNKKVDLVIEEIFDESASDIEWIVEDEAIAKVENGKIIPLKVGRTVLTATNGGVNYRINLVVTSDLLNNPKTFNISYVLVSLIVVGIFGSLIYKKQKN